MKKGIKPIWEDEANEKGGHLAFKVKKDDINFIWLHLALSAIGEQFDRYLDQTDDICGLSASLRKNNEAVVSIWNKKADLMNVDSVSALVFSIVPDLRFTEAPSYRVHHQ